MHKLICKITSQEDDGCLVSIIERFYGNSVQFGVGDLTTNVIIWDYEIFEELVDEHSMFL